MQIFLTGVTWPQNVELLRPSLYPSKLMRSESQKIVTKIILITAVSSQIRISFLELQIYLIAEEECGSGNSKALLKCFSPGKNNAFDNERKILESLPEKATRNDIPSLKWYTKGEKTILIVFAIKRHIVLILRLTLFGSACHHRRTKSF